MSTIRQKSIITMKSQFSQFPRNRNYGVHKCKIVVSCTVIYRFGRKAINLQGVIRSSYSDSKMMANKDEKRKKIENNSKENYEHFLKFSV
jgi:hypothetical protein